MRGDTPSNTSFIACEMPRKPKPKPSPSSTRSIETLKPSSEPYPDLPSPTPEECRAVRDALLAHHGFPEEFARYRRSTTDSAAEKNAAGEGETAAAETVLDGLVSTLLSQNTTESNSRRAFESLKSAFPTWDQVLDAEAKLVEDAIRCGGLASTKAARIKNILRALKDKRGEICLEYLRQLSVDEVKAELSKFKGIGPKTVACVLMFHLQQDDFPVDTHVYRITRDIGWIPIKADREQAYLHLNDRIPNDLKFDLNCLLVTHGRLCRRCAIKGVNQKTKDAYQASCPLTEYCKSRRE
ncbi:DNA glycosylase [Canna indica]|uniref:DNA glycosylase n=1 Tax=Canna indica TaxID=4628 RepID=A0AAQ3KSF3_9LILI|nr:DNA glycosylase [Canna indica]